MNNSSKSDKGNFFTTTINKIKHTIKKNRDTKEVFTNIYKNNKWNSNESISGKGSELSQTEYLIEQLSELIEKLEVKTMLDVPCGDFNWMQHVNLSKTSYTGGDIVEDLIAQNKKKFSNKGNVDFRVIDLTKDSLPKMDLIFVRDCLVHLSIENIHSAIKNLKDSGSKYLLTTTFPSTEFNKDITTGSWRRINLQKEPFNFPAPELIINENCPQDGGKFDDKSMALWKIADINK